MQTFRVASSSSHVIRRPFGQIHPIRAFSIALPQISIPPAQIASFNADGFLHLPQLFPLVVAARLSRWMQEVKTWPGETDKTYMQYEEIDSRGNNVLCTSEAFADCHPGLSSLLKHPSLLSKMKQLLNSQEAFLFKEKINYKLPFAGGYPPHIDAPSYTHIDPEVQTHITLLICVEPATEENGCLEVVPGSHRHHPVETERDQTLSRKWANEQRWVAFPMKPGDALAFDSFLAHRSNKNQSPTGRALLYATYNGGKDLREAYYAHRKTHWPATAHRKPGKAYAEGANVYAWGTPMETVQNKKKMKY